MSDPVQRDGRMVAILPRDPMRQVLDAPKISLVTPNFNTGAYLEATLRSVLAQRYDNLEYSVVDGGSTDNSRQIIENYKNKLFRAISEPDHGHADAINKGFAGTSGEIMGWVNSDDILLPGSLNAIGELFAKYPEVQWITGHPSALYPDGRWQLQALPNWSRIRFLNGNYRWVQQESTFWRRSLWERAGGYVSTDIELAVDLELWTRFFRHAELYTYDLPLATFRYREGQRSEQFRDQYAREAKYVLDRELELLDERFRLTFRHYLPAKITPRDLPLSLELDLELSVCDPPIITVDDVDARTEAVSKRAYFQRPKTPPIIQPDSPSDLRRFKNLHVGERCFVMGNGPSLNKTNLKLLDEETVFGCNSIFLLFDKISWRPKYYTCVDARVLPDRALDIENMLQQNPQMTSFFPVKISQHDGQKLSTYTRTLIAPDRGRFYFQERHNSVSEDPFSMFSNDINAYVVQPFTVAITMLQLAAYMGFKEIYLIGCDTDYKIPADVEQDQANRLGLISTQDTDPNHFDPRYFGQGRKWHTPQTHKMIEHHKFAKQACERLGVRVFNATVGGKLEVYPRVKFDDLF